MASTKSSFDESKKEVVADLGRVDFAEGDGQFHVEVIRYNEGPTQVSVRRFYFSRGEMKPQAMRGWCSPGEASARAESYNLAVKWLAKNGDKVVSEVLSVDDLERQKEQLERRINSAKKANP